MADAGSHIAPEDKEAGALSRGRPRHVMLVVGEPSGDVLGAGLMRALKARDPDIQITGSGGHLMQAEGLRSIFPIEDTSVMGPAAIVPRLPLIFRRIWQMRDHALETKPDLVVLIDSPDFTHRVAARIRKRAPDIPIIDYVAPTVWAWRQGRAKAMASYVDMVLALFPFEARFFKAVAGLACRYVGHPAIERIPSPQAGIAFRAKYHIPAEHPVLAVLPGSRPNELKRLLPVFSLAVGRLAEKHPDLRVVLPTLPHLAIELKEATKHWRPRPLIVFDEEEKKGCFSAATAALAASGTVSLELGLAGIPMAVAYRIDTIAGYVVGRMLKVPSVVLVNLVLDRPAIPEFLQDKASPDALVKALSPLLEDTEGRRRMVRDLDDFRAEMGVGGAPPSERAADAVFDLLERPS